MEGESVLLSIIAVNEVLLSVLNRSTPPNSHAPLRRLRPHLKPILPTLPCTQLHRLRTVQRRQVPVIYTRDRLSPWLNVVIYEECEEREGEGPVEEEVAMPLDLAAVLRIEVDGVGVEGEGGVAEEEGGGWGEGVRYCWGVLGWFLLLVCLHSRNNGGRDKRFNIFSAGGAAPLFLTFSNSSSDRSYMNTIFRLSTTSAPLNSSSLSAHNRPLNSSSVLAFEASPIRRSIPTNTFSCPGFPLIVTSRIPSTHAYRRPSTLSAFFQRTFPPAHMRLTNGSPGD